MQDIAEAIDRIFDYTASHSLESFAADRMAVDAVVRNFEVIGEAARHVDAETATRLADIPWQDMRDLRNLLIVLKNDTRVFKSAMSRLCFEFDSSLLVHESTGSEPRRPVLHTHEGSLFCQRQATSPGSFKERELMPKCESPIELPNRGTAALKFWQVLQGC